MHRNYLDFRMRKQTGSPTQVVEAPLLAAAPELETKQKLLVLPA